MNILIDVNYIARKNAWVKTTGENFLKTKEERDFLMHSILYSINIIIKRYNYVNRIILCYDSPIKSWRFGLPYHDIYKSNRKLSVKRYDNDSIKKMISEMHLLMSQNGYCSMMMPKAEGDDLLFIASNILFNAGESSVIVTADADMKQLTKSDGKNYIFIFNNDSAKTQIHYVDEINAFKDNEILSMEEFFDNDMESLNKQIIYGRCEQIIPEESLFIKILSGDKSDCIPSSYFYTKGTMQYGFTDKRAIRVFERYYKEDFFNKLETVDSIFADEKKLLLLAERVINEVDKNISDLKIKDCLSRLKTNKRYIHLAVSSYENDGYYEELEQYVIHCISQSSKSDNFDQIIASLENQEQKMEDEAKAFDGVPF